jgi:hypothetical protein
MDRETLILLAILIGIMTFLPGYLWYRENKAENKENDND